MSDFEIQARRGQGPGLSSKERELVTVLGLDVVNARRRSDRDFDVEVDYRVRDQDGTTGWLPLVLLHEEWKRRPVEIGALAVEGGSPHSADDCSDDFECVLDIDDQDKFMAMCHAIWATQQAKKNS